MTRQRSILTHEAGLGVDGHHLRGGGLPLQGLEGHPDGVKVALQSVGLICPMDKLVELTPII